MHRPDRRQLRSQFVDLEIAVPQSIAQQQVAPTGAESASSPTVDPTDGVAQFIAPRPLARLISQRLTILMQLDGIDRQRQHLVKTPGLPHDAANELARQSRELKRIPTGEMATATLKKLNRRLDGADPDTDPDDEDELQAGEEVIDDAESVDINEAVDADQDDEEPGDDRVEDEVVWGIVRKHTPVLHDTVAQLLEGS